MTAPPAAPRLTITADSAALRLVLPAPRPWYTFVLLAVLLPLWGIVFAASLAAIFGPAVNSLAAAGFILVWLAGWCGVGLFLLYVLVSLFAGRELVTLSPDGLTIRRDLYGYGSERRYRLHLISQLRCDAERPSFTAYFTTLRLFGFGGGRLRFDYSGLDFRFGAGLTRSEAEQVAGELTRHPLLAGSTVPGQSHPS